jgi:hypothetical protein
MTGELTIRKSQAINDWYVIERRYHDGREWIETSTIDGIEVNSLQMSSRITDTCVEGTSADMLAIADAIEQRYLFAAKRCAIEYEPKRHAFQIWSPRNSRTKAWRRAAVCDQLAKEIRDKCQTPT